MEADAQRHLALLPQLLNGTEILRPHAAAGKIVDRGHAEPIELAEILARAGKLVGIAWPRNLRREEIECAVDPGEHAGELAGRILLGLAAGNFGVGRQFHQLHAGGRDPCGVVETLHVNGPIGRRLGKLRDRRPAFFGKLQFGPAAADLDPGAGRQRARRLADEVETFGETWHADEAQLDGKREAGAQRVDVGIHQARHDRAPAKIDAAGAWIGKLEHVDIGAGAQDFAVADRKRFGDRRRRVEGDDLAVQEHGIGRRRWRLCAGVRGREQCEGE